MGRVRYRWKATNYTNSTHFRACELVERFPRYGAGNPALFPKSAFSPYLREYCTYRHGKICVGKPLHTPFQRYQDVPNTCRGTGATALAGVVILVPLPVQAPQPRTQTTVIYTQGAVRKVHSIAIERTWSRGNRPSIGGATGVPIIPPIYPIYGYYRPGASITEPQYQLQWLWYQLQGSRVN